LHNVTPDALKALVLVLELPHGLFEVDKPLALVQYQTLVRLGPQPQPLYLLRELRDLEHRF